MNGASGKDIFAKNMALQTGLSSLPGIWMAPHKASLRLLFADFHWVESFASVKFRNRYVDCEMSPEPPLPQGSSK